MTESFAQPVICPVLIGRTSMIEALHRLIDGVSDNDGQMVLIAGEAGIGKSRLVAEAKAYAGTRGLSALQGTCFPQDSACPYAPLLDLLHARFAGHPPAVIAAEIGPFARELSPLIPDLVPIPEDLHPESTRPPALDPEQARRRLFDALAHCLVRRDVQESVLLIVEDLHWCDEGSLDFLLYLLRRCADQPLLLIGTYRSEEVSPRLRHWLAQLDRERLAQELFLPPLTRDEIASMLQAIFGDGCPVRTEFLDAIYDLAEGNPFYVEELLKSLVAAGEIFYAGGAWDCKPMQELHIPRSLHDAVQQRVAQLNTDTRRVLTVAAVIGRHFDFMLLQSLAQLDEFTLLSLIKELIAAQLVVEESTEQFAFRHALTRQVIYSELLARERVMLHRVVAETIEQIYAESLDQHLGDLAYHFYEAEDWRKALAYAQRAGGQAQRLYTPRAAVEQFTRALQAAQQLAQRSGVDDATQPAPVLTHLYSKRGQAYEMLGDFEHTLADYEAALELAHVTADLQLEWQALLNLGMLWAGHDYAQTGIYYQRALDLARTVDDPAMLAHSLNRVGNWYMNTAQPLEALRLHREALAIFEYLHDQRGVAETYDLLGMASYNSADLPGCIAYYERAVALFRKLGDRRGLISSLTMLTVRGGTYAISSMTVDATSFIAAVRDGELALQEARTIDWRAGEAFASFALGWTLGPQGEYARALELSQCGLQIAEEIAHRQWKSAAHWTLGMLYLDLLALPLVRQHLEQALELGKEINSALWTDFAVGGLALAYMLDHELDQAATLLEAACDPAAPVQALWQWFMLYARVRLMLARGDPALALQLLNQVSPAGMHGIGERDTPRLATVRGEALAVLGRTAEAEAVLRTVQEITHTQGARPQLWRTQVALGNLYQTQQRHEDAEREFSAARMIIEELAASIPDQSIRTAFLRKATAMLPHPHRLSPRRIVSAQFGELTPREREVAALIGQGKSNREIAGELVIGERTVETHVSHILAKLDYTSRREIATWAADKELVHDDR